jgi:hypothetical protein
MTRIAILFRSGHRLQEDLRMAISSLSSAGIGATEEGREKQEVARRFLWVQQDTDLDLAMRVLRAAGLAVAKM